MSTTRLIIGCGYLGCRVAREWLSQGDRVMALTRSVQNAADLRALGIEPLLGDITAPESLPVFPQADSILYAVGLDRRSGKSQREVYVQGLHNVLSRLNETPPRFFYISSTSVYGQSAGEWVDEESHCQPATPNGQVCLDAEQLLLRSVPTANILRLAGIYGPGRLIARIEKLREGQPLEGDPDAWLNLIHVDDAVAAVIACDARGVPGRTYLVSDDRPSRRREYYERLAQLVGAPRPQFPAIEAANTTPRALNKRCRNQRIHAELHVTLRYPTLDTGLAAVVKDVHHGDTENTEKTSDHR